MAENKFSVVRGGCGDEYPIPIQAKCELKIATISESLSPPKGSSYANAGGYHAVTVLDFKKNKCLGTVQAHTCDDELEPTTEWEPTSSLSKDSYESHGIFHTSGWALGKVYILCNLVEWINLYFVNIWIFFQTNNLTLQTCILSGLQVESVQRLPFVRWHFTHRQRWCRGAWQSSLFIHILPDWRWSEVRLQQGLRTSTHGYAFFQVQGQCKSDHQHSRECVCHRGGWNPGETVFGYPGVQNIHWQALPPMPWCRGSCLVCEKSVRLCGQAKSEPAECSPPKGDSARWKDSAYAHKSVGWKQR